LYSLTLHCLRVLVRAAGVGGHVEAGDAEHAGRPYRLDQRVEYGRRLLVVLAAGVVRLGLVTDRVHALVGAFAAGLLADLVGGIGLGEVDRDGADLLGLGEPFGHPVDDEDLRGAAQQRGVGGHQPDRTRAVDRHALAGRDLCQFAPVIAGREDVGEQHEVRLELGAFRQLQAVEVGVGHAEPFRLATGVRAHGHVTVGAAREAGVHRQAEAGVPGEAVLAEAAGHVERHHDPVAGFERGHPVAHLLDQTQVLVAEHDARLGSRAALVHVQIGSADRRGRDAHDDVVGVLDLGVRDLFDLDLVGLLVDDRLHLRHLRGTRLLRTSGGRRRSRRPAR
jgi:hypothetical protein